MRVFARDWVETFAAVMLTITSGYSFISQAYGTAVITAMCAGLVAGMVFTRWAMRR